jgi:glyoxalase superfamily protein
MSSWWHAVVVDSADPARLGRWWAEVLEYRVLAEDAATVMVGPDAASRPVLWFARHTGPTVGRNRLHLNLWTDDRDAQVERLVNMGARHIDTGADDSDPRWIVLADPEGNEFRVTRG